MQHQDPESQAPGTAGLLWFCTGPRLGAEPRSTTWVSALKNSLCSTEVPSERRCGPEHTSNWGGSGNGWGHCWEDICVSLISTSDSGQERRCCVGQDCKHAGLLWGDPAQKHLKCRGRVICTLRFVNSPWPIPDLGTTPLPDSKYLPHQWNMRSYGI